MLKCEICGEITKYNKWCELLRWHIKPIHNENYTEEEYIVKFLHNGIHPICHNKDCNNFVKWYPAENKFQKYCSKKCASSCEDFKKLLSIKAKERFSNPKTKKLIFDKRIKTNLKKYGVEHVSQVSEIKEKIKETTLEKYGSFSNTPGVILMQQYNIDNKEELNEKRKAWWTEENISKVNINRENSVFEKYGVTNVMYIKEVVDKIFNTIMERYNLTCSLLIKDVNGIEKRRITFKEKYGTEFPSQCEFIKKKITETCLEKYGSSCYLNSERHRKFAEENLGWTKLEDMDEFTLYKRKVDNLTKRILK